MKMKSLLELASFGVKTVIFKKKDPILGTVILISNSFQTPCYQCVVIENGKISVCGRCIDISGLCDECGYFFVAEYTLLFRGNLKVCFEMLRTYLKYI